MLVRFATAAGVLGTPPPPSTRTPADLPWPYWQRKFKTSWPVLAACLGLPAS